MTPKHLQSELKDHILSIIGDAQGWNVVWDDEPIGHVDRTSNQPQSEALCLVINTQLPYLRMNLAHLAEHWMYQGVADVSQLLVWKLSIPWEDRVQGKVRNNSPLHYQVYTRLYHQDLQTPAKGERSSDWWRGLDLTVKNGKPAFEPSSLTLDSSKISALEVESILWAHTPFNIQKVQGEGEDLVYRFTYQGGSHE